MNEFCLVQQKNALHIFLNLTEEKRLSDFWRKNEKWGVVLLVKKLL